jgi:hypothetical protein
LWLLSIWSRQRGIRGIQAAPVHGASCKTPMRPNQVPVAHSSPVLFLLQYCHFTDDEGEVSEESRPSSSASVCAGVSAEGADSVSPDESFTSPPLNRKLLSNIDEGMNPTTLQSYILPLLLNGSDVMCWAQASSETSASFLIPILNKSLDEIVRRWSIFTTSLGKVGCC